MPLENLVRAGIWSADEDVTRIAEASSQPPILVHVAPDRYYLARKRTKCQKTSVLLAAHALVF